MPQRNIIVLLLKHVENVQLSSLTVYIVQHTYVRIENSSFN